MFAKSVIDSDLFLDMPLSAQCLYFHLAMRADDDGFVNCTKKVVRLLGASDDDLKLLAAKQFVLPFQSGVIVIRHWRVHNYLQADRYKPTECQHERAMLDVENNGAYCLTSQPDTAGIPGGNQRLTQDRLGKGSLRDIPPLSPKGEGGEVEQTALPATTLGGTQASPAPQKAWASARQKRPALTGAFDRFWGAYPRHQGKEAARKVWAKIRPDDALLAEMLAALERQRASDQWRRDGGRFIPLPATWLNGRRWEDEEAAPTEGKAQSYPAIPQRILL